MDLCMHVIPGVVLESAKTRTLSRVLKFDRRLVLTYPLGMVKIFRKVTNLPICLERLL